MINVAIIGTGNISAQHIDRQRGEPVTRSGLRIVDM